MASLHKFTREITAFTTNRGMPKASHIKKAMQYFKETQRQVVFPLFFFSLATTSTRHSHIVAPMLQKSPLIYFLYGMTTVQDIRRGYDDGVKSKTNVSDSV